MQKTGHIILYGFLIWLIPFVTSFFFYGPENTLIIDLIFFKTIMIVVGSLVGVCLAVKYFSLLSENYYTAGIGAGIMWFSISILLDYIVLLPISQMHFNDYMLEIGLRYLMIPIITIGMGFVLDLKGTSDISLKKEVIKGSDE
ncbi:MAG: hypothetical protein KAJ56_04365 [Candidatus Aenigmarchaeota archaeon]|nr:hypothetical protein [Candidatus Aenigmarchaeota archaeon]